jgi:hypothetical protein
MQLGLVVEKSLIADGGNVLYLFRFVANGILEFSVTFPIATSTPGLVGALWGVSTF